MQTILKISNLKFLDIIDYPEIEISKEQATFICGESGCGKSTLLKLINGVISSDSGEILFNGQNIDLYDSIILRKQILLCSQSVYLFDKTIKENFDAFYNFRDLPYLNPTQINEYINICCLDFPLETSCINLSGGERQRLFIAICLSLMPEILMLDEPTAALDDQTSINLLHNIKSFCKEKSMTLVVVCHNKMIIDKYADFLISLKTRCKNE